MGGGPGWPEGKPKPQAGRRWVLPRFRDRQRELGLSTKELARRLDDMNDSFVGRVARGSSRPAPGVEQLFADVLGLPVDELFAPATLTLAEAVAEGYGAASTIRAAIAAGELAAMGGRNCLELERAELDRWKALPRFRWRLCEACWRLWPARARSPHRDCWTCRQVAQVPTSAVPERATSAGPLDARNAQNLHRLADQHFRAACEAFGWRSLADAAEELDRTGVSVASNAMSHGIGGKLPLGIGKPRWAFTAGELEELRRVIGSRRMVEEIDREWIEGGPRVRGLIDHERNGRKHLSGKVRRAKKNVWNGRKSPGAPTTAARDPEYEQKRKKVIEALDRHSKVSERTLERLSGLPRRQVRTIKAAWQRASAA